MPTPACRKDTILYILYNPILRAILVEKVKRENALCSFLGQKSLHQPDLSLSSFLKLYISGGDKCRLWALRLITLNCSMPNCSIHSFMYDMGWNPVYKRHDHFVEITTLWHHFANQSKIWGLGETIQWWSPTWQNDQKYQTLGSRKSSKLHFQYSTPHQLNWNIFKV